MLQLNGFRAASMPSAQGVSCMVWSIASMHLPVTMYQHVLQCSIGICLAAVQRALFAELQSLLCGQERVVRQCHWCAF